MFLAFLVLAPDPQPTTFEVIGYQSVQHALPDGRPDPDAGDNHYIRTKTQWFLILDSNDLPVDAAGNRHVVLPALSHEEYRKTEEKGRIRGEFARRFEKVSPAPKGKLGKAEFMGKSSNGALDYEYPASQRIQYWTIRNVVQQVETHTDGKRRATRSVSETHYGIASQGWHTDRPFVPDREPRMSFGGPRVQVDPPTLGYGKPVIPKGDAF